MKKLLTIFIQAIILLTVWIIMSNYIDNSETVKVNLILPHPLKVINSLINILRNIGSYEIIFNSLSRLFLAIIISLLIGMISGIIASLSKVFSYLFSPIVTAIRTIPIASILIILLLFIGAANAPLVITTLVLIPLFYEMFKESILNLEKEYLDVIKLDSNINLYIIRTVFIPLIANNIYITFIQAIGLGFKVIIMSELISYTDKSLGKIIYTEKLNLNIDNLYAWTIIIIVIVSIIEQGIKRTKQNIIK